MAGQHTAMGPSSAARICECLASYAYHDPSKDEPTIYAIEGTATHKIHERRLKNPKIPGHKYIGEIITVKEKNGDHYVEVTTEMVNAVEESIERIKDILNDLRAEGLNPKMFVEKRVDITRWTPLEEQFGTADVIIVAPPKLVVIDYKNGVGVEVPAVENVQGALYGLGTYDALSKKYKFTEVDICIHQPNINSFDKWSLPIKDFLAFGKQIRAKLDVAVQPNPPFGPSDKTCMFCSYKNVCKARATAIQNALAGCFDDVREPAAKIELKKVTPPTEMTTRELGQAWKKIKMIESWINDVKTECEHRLFNGEKEELELKLVEGRKSYSYKNEKRALKFLLHYAPKKEWYKISMISISEARKKLPSAAREVFNKKFVHTQPGKPTVALETDRRDEHTLHSECFEDVSESSDFDDIK